MKIEDALESAYRYGVANAHLTHIQRDHGWATIKLPRLLASLEEDGMASVEIILDDRTKQSIADAMSRGILLDLVRRIKETKAEMDEVLVDAEPGLSANYIQGKSDMAHNVLAMLEGALKTGG